jgi:hypothetical protein
MGVKDAEQADQQTKAGYGNKAENKERCHKTVRRAWV